MVSGRDTVRVVWTATLELIFRSVLLLDLQQGLGVAPSVVHGIVGVLRLPQVLEVDEHVLDHALVERAEVRRAMAEGVLAQEVVEVPVDELPVEAVVVGDEHRADRRRPRQSSRRTAA